MLIPSLIKTFLDIFESDRAKVLPPLSRTLFSIFESSFQDMKNPQVDPTFSLKSIEKGLNRSKDTPYIPGKEVFVVSYTFPDDSGKESHNGAKR